MNAAPIKDACDLHMTGGKAAILRALEKAEVTPIGATPKTPEQEKPLDAYYDATRKEFILKNRRGNWLAHPSRQFTSLLKAERLATCTAHAEQIMAEIINDRDVQYTGSLAGNPPGFYEANGVRMLITDGPKLIEPKVGDWPTIGRLIDGLLGADPQNGDLQVLTFKCWLRSGVESVTNGQWRPAQILSLAGPIGCGKSLLQRLVTQAIGGRSADAFRYLNGNQFNRDLFSAEHLVVDDAQASTDFRTRMAMAAHLKSIAVGRDHSCHGKGRDAVNLRPIWRCSISLNDEGECLLVLPPLHADIADKIHILKCYSPAVPFPTETPDAMERYWQTLMEELPAFISHCLTIEPPADRIDARFGIRAFHHPALVLELESQAPEIAFLEMIDAELWTNQTTTEWEGTARELESALTGINSKVREQTRRLLAWQTACGTYLGRLAKNQPERIEQDRSTEKRGWIIRKPRFMTP